MNSSCAFFLDRARTEAFREASRHFSLRNYKAAAMILADRGRELGRREREKLARGLAWAVDRFPELFDPSAVETIRAMDEARRRPELAAAEVGEVRGHAPDPCVGRVECLLLAGKTGTVRLLEVAQTRRPRQRFHPAHEESLRSAAVRGLVEAATLYGEMTGVQILPPLDRFSFRIVDLDGRPCGPVAGASAGLATAAAAFSVLSGLAVPRDVAFTGEIGPDGSILPVVGAPEKVEAFFRERPYARLALVPAANEGACAAVPNGRVKGVKSVEAALSILWGERPLEGLELGAAKYDVDVHRAVRALGNLGATMDPAVVVGFADIVADCLRRRRRELPETEHQKYMFSVLSRRGQARAHAGAYREALADYDRAKTMADRCAISGEPYIRLLLSEAAVFSYTFRYAEAEKLVRQALHAPIDRAQRGTVLSALGELHLHKGVRSFPKAEKALRESLGLVVARDRARSHIYLARLYTAWGRFNEAEVEIDAAKESIEGLGSGRRNAGARYLDLAEVNLLCRRGLAENDEPSLARAVRRALEKDDGGRHFTDGLVGKYKGLALVALDEADEGLRALERSAADLDVMGTPGYRILAATVLLEHAGIMARAGETGEAVRLIKEARSRLRCLRPVGEYFREDLRKIDILTRRSPIDTRALGRACARLVRKVPYC